MQKQCTGFKIYLICSAPKKNITSLTEFCNFSACWMRYFAYLCSRNHKGFKNMTGVTAKRNSVSDPKTAVSCGLTHSAAIRRVSSAAGGPSAAIPETVIIGDRGILSQAAKSAPRTASPAYTLLIYYPQNLRQDDHQDLQTKVPSQQTEDHA